MIPKSENRFSEEIMLKQRIKRDDDSKKSHPALVGECDDPMNRETPLLVGPALLHQPARSLCQGGEAVKTVFVAVLGVNALARPEREVMAEHAHALRLAADQVHLDAMAVAVVDRAMHEAGGIEIAAELAVDALQHIEIEARGDA